MATVTQPGPIPNIKRRVWVALRMMGHKVQFSINGFAAIDVARMHRPNIIIVDIGLPDLQGDQLARRLRYEPGVKTLA